MSVLPTNVTEQISSNHSFVLTAANNSTIKTRSEICNSGYCTLQSLSLDFHHC
ncbi:unnamed protein product [Hymenolepis diminuta]|uniref:Uncharacterized protein n=1 Tax=Hymenolepis diminuta TaxID=6216 RepID=A0A564Z3J6_HYMDI|nr:unnamed protein product [Hymenolepis diminuta]